MSPLVIALLATLAMARAPKWHELTADYSFSRYTHDFRKQYGPREHEMRKGIFQHNLKQILHHNQGTSTYKMGVNHLTDLTQEEVASLRGTRHSPSYKARTAKPYSQKGTLQVPVTIPDSLDYRASVPAVLTAVKDQGLCGDCWAHSVTESIESSWAIATGELYVLSQQQITSCTPRAGSCYSCNGSFPSLAYDYAADTGITEEWVYPFESYTNKFPQCRSDIFVNYPLRNFVNISGFYEIAPNNAADTMAALSSLGPLSILVDASSWSSYEYGVFDGCSYANNITLDHAVQLVGYGFDNVYNASYWIVRNSWSPAWGESGYIRLIREPVAECGWNTGASNVADCYGDGPAQSRACGQCGLLFGPTYPIANP